MKVIGVSGLPGSGKSLVSNMSKKKGAIVIRMGDIVRDEARKRNEKSKITAIKLRKEYGDYVVAKLTIKKIKRILNDRKHKSNSKKIIVVVEGIRSLYEIDLFRDNFDDFTLVSIFASPKVRFNRLKNRRRDDDSTVFEEFKKRDLTELNFGIGQVIALSDFLIVNQTSIGEYKTQINNFLQKNFKF